jgi:hypothetical protein
MSHGSNDSRRYAGGFECIRRPGQGSAVTLGEDIGENAGANDLVFQVANTQLLRIEARNSEPHAEDTGCSVAAAMNSP